MQTLEQCYHQIAQDPDLWSYYSNPPPIDNVWQEDAQAYEYMGNYFDRAGKGLVFKDKFLTTRNKDILDRARHIISTFLLGIKIAECFGINMETRNINNMNLKYYWFLACLYHDVGYAYENDQDIDKLRAVSSKGLQAIRKICHIRYLQSRIFITNSKSVVEFYLKCRAVDPGRKGPVIDHGIVGGLLLFDKLRRQFDRAWTMRTLDPESTKDSFSVLNNNVELHLSKRHFADYAKAADAIITHNIWKTTLEYYIKKYPYLGIPANVNLKSKLEIDNKLCFLLSLADTIEPLKKDKDNNGAITLRDVEICSQVDGCGIKLQMDEKVFTDYYWEIEKLTTWVKVEVHVNDTVAGKKEIRIYVN